VSRSHHVPLETAETAMHGRARTSVQRRAALEEQLLTAYAAGDRERVSELRAVLAGVAGKASGDA
jgi:hypothetical protein